MAIIGSLIRLWREVFDDWLTRIAGLLFLLIMAVVGFNHFSDLPYRYPILGVFSFSLVPMLFVLGGFFFILAILRYR